MASTFFTDRVVQYPGRVTMTPTGNTNEYDIARAEGNVTEPGTPFNAEAFNGIADEIIQIADDNIITDAELTALEQRLGISGGLSDILNEILDLFGKTLWSGSITSGNITVPGTDKYAAYAVSISGTVCLALRDGNAVSAYGISASTVATSAQQFIKAAVFSISGDTWTLVRAKQTNHNETTTAHSLSSTAMQITKIIGLIPNWGGS